MAIRSRSIKNKSVVASVDPVLHYGGTIKEIQTDTLIPLHYT